MIKHYHLKSLLILIEYYVQIEGEYYDCYETYSMYGTKSDVMKPFNSHIKRVRKLINKVEEGKKIADSELEGLAH